MKSKIDFESTIYALFDETSFIGGFFSFLEYVVLLIFETELILRILLSLKNQTLNGLYLINCQEAQICVLYRIAWCQHSLCKRQNSHFYRIHDMFFTNFPNTNLRIYSTMFLISKRKQIPCWSNKTFYPLSFEQILTNIK